MAKKDVYKGWKPFGLLTGLTSRSGIFDNSPLRDLVFDRFTGQIERKFSYGVSDAETGEYLSWNETYTMGGDIREGVIASGAIPGVFPTSILSDADGVKHYLYDGGCVQGIDLFGAINRCYEITDNDEDIILDIIFLGAFNIEDIDASKYKSFGVLFRYLAIA
jgi:hypothetical protein